MKRVLIVAPSYAPSSNPPTHRVRFFARHLPRFGWAPEILSVDPAHYEEAADPDIGRLLPDVTVHRVPALPASLTRRLGLGDLGIRSLPYLHAELRRLVSKARPDLIFIPGPPWHPFVLGPRMLDEFGVPYVLDYIDPWTNHEAGKPPWTKAYWYRRLALLLEPTAARRAAHIVAVSDGTNDGIRTSYPELPAEMFTGIPYGFEASDFDAIREHPRPNPYWDVSDGQLHVTYVGAMLPKGYETLRALFHAIRALRTTDPALSDRIQLHFFGTTYDPRPRGGLVEPVAREMGLRDKVHEHPARIPYLDALTVLTSADILLGLGSSERHYTASKIFPCILARRPLLAIYHEESSVCDIVRESRAGALVTYSDADRAEDQAPRIVEALVRLAAPGSYRPEDVRWSSFEDYSAVNMTRRLVDAFERALARHVQRDAEEAQRPLASA